MKKSTATEVKAVKSETALAGASQALARMGELYGAYVGLDVHKEKIAVAVAECGRAEPAYDGEVVNKPSKGAELIERLCVRYGGGRLLFVNEVMGCIGRSSPAATPAR